MLHGVKWCYPLLWSALHHSGKTELNHLQITWVCTVGYNSPKYNTMNHDIVISVTGGVFVLFAGVVTTKPNTARPTRYYVTHEP